MKSFDDWLRDFSKPAVDPIVVPQIDQDLLYFYESHGLWVYPCVVCGNVIEICCEPCEFDPDMQYCGGSPRCCP